MAAAGAAKVFYWIAMGAAAAGAVHDAKVTRDANRRRQAILEQELRSKELAALDEENQRLIALREANDDLLANAGGVGAYSSPSLIAGRQFNFKMGMQDIENIRFNVDQSRAGISAKIGILQANSRAATTKSIFDVAGIVASGASKSAMLKKGST